MKKLVLILVSLFSINAAYSQVAYYDALSLSKLLDAHGHFKTGQPQQDSLRTILSKYFGGQVRTVGDFSDPVKNPFMYRYFAVREAGGFHGIVTEGVLGGLGNFNVTNIADGIAQFLIERGKDEIDEAFFIKLKAFMDEYPEFSTIFPNTYTFLGNFNSWEYSNLLNTLRAAFNNDLNQLPANLIKIRNLKPSDCNSGDTVKCRARIQAITNFLNNTNGGIFLLSALKVSDGITRGQKIPDIIDTLVQPNFLLGYKNTDSIKTVNVKNSLKLVNIVSKSLRSNEAGRNYISSTEFDGLVNNGTLRTIYLGLIFQQIAKANIVINGENVYQLLPPEGIDGMMNYLGAIQEQAENLQTVLHLLQRDKLNAKPDLSGDYSAMVENLQQLLQAIYNIKVLNGGLTTPHDLNVFFDYTNQSLQIANDILIKNYNAAVMATLNLAATTVKASAPQDQQLADFLSNFLRYASFASNVVTANNPADVKAAIDAVALPAGSYTAKQRSQFNISLNGYIGYAWDMQGFFSKEYAHGFYAPIGFSFTWGSKRKPFFQSIPITLFASVIDVGSFISYNLSDNNQNTDALKQDVRLESIFSPSLQVFVGIPKTPVVFGAGWRMTPKLFYSGNSGFVTIQPQSVFNVSILIDIPIFTLHSTPFK